MRTEHGEPVIEIGAKTPEARAPRVRLLAGHELRVNRAAPTNRAGEHAFLDGLQHLLWVAAEGSDLVEEKRPPRRLEEPGLAAWHR